MTFYEKFLKECGKTGLAPSVVMEEMGMNRSTLTGWKKGKSVPSDAALANMAKYFGCSMDEFAAARAETVKLRPSRREKRKWSSVLDDQKMVPSVGLIACGSPITAYENIEELVPVPPRVQADFALRCRGDSMINAHIFDGDYVFIKQQPVVENGQIAAVLIGDEATLKRVYLFDDHIRLMPENPSHAPMDYFGEDMNQVQILGKAVAVIGYLNGEGKR